jgi:hypothetical protein
MVGSRKYHGNGRNPMNVERLWLLGMFGIRAFVSVESEYSMLVEMQVMSL